MPIQSAEVTGNCTSVSTSALSPHCSSSRRLFRRPLVVACLTFESCFQRFHPLCHLEFCRALLFSCEDSLGVMHGCSTWTDFGWSVARPLSKLSAYSMAAAPSIASDSSFRLLRSNNCWRTEGHSPVINRCSRTLGTPA